MIFLIVGCSRTKHRNETFDGKAHEFGIHWPPIVPNVDRNQAKLPLLRGDVSIKESTATDKSHALEIVLTISRSSNEVERKFWNSQLSFSDVPWMDDVRVWDSDMQWQWPNLPYLLRRHGKERIERYGGVDPSKLIDNDFAAVLIRKFNLDGTVESKDTLNSPLVSAVWRGNVDGPNDIQTVVHVAKSELFTVHVGASDEHENGMLKLWLIYADFLGSNPPRSWPKEQEWAGGILTYCEIVWDKQSGESFQGTVHFLKPSTSTGFDWEKWSEDPSAPAKSRLSDMVN
jgi:hypothetical protein